MPDKKIIKAVIAFVLVIGSLVAGVWAFDERYTLNKLFMAGMQQQNAQTLQIQRNFFILNAEQDYKWKKFTEEKAEEAWRKNPSDPVLKMKLEKATKDRCEAEKRWLDLKSK